MLKWITGRLPTAEEVSQHAARHGRMWNTLGSLGLWLCVPHNPSAPTMPRIVAIHVSLEGEIRFWCELQKRFMEPDPRASYLPLTAEGVPELPELDQKIAQHAAEVRCLTEERDRLQRACDEGLPREFMQCPHCNEPHVEKLRHDDPTKNGATRPHHHHRCYHCGGEWDYGEWSFGVLQRNENATTIRLRAKGLQVALYATQQHKRDADPATRLVLESLERELEALVARAAVRDPYKPRVYIAGTRHDPLIASGHMRRVVEDAGGVVVSRWHDQEPGDTDGSTEARQRTAGFNYADLRGAHVLLAVGYGEHHLRGAHTEFGYALGKGMPLMIYGNPGCMNTMTEVPCVRYVSNPEGLAAALARVREGLIERADFFGDGT